MSVLGNGNEHCFPINDLVYAFMEESGSKKTGKRWSEEKDGERKRGNGNERLFWREREGGNWSRSVTRGKRKVDSD